MFNNLLATSSFFGLFLASRAFAGVYVTNPVAETTISSGQTLTINWVDDGIYPLLNSIGPSSIALYTGSSLQQTFLASIAEEVDVSRVGTIDWAVDPGVGPSGAYYFIRFTSKNLKSSSDASFPHTAFSAKFTLDKMTGTFNSTVLAQLNATASAMTTGSGSATAIMESGSTGSAMGGAGETMMTRSGSGSAASASGMSSGSAMGETMITSTVRPTTTSTSATRSISTSSTTTTPSTSPANSSSNAISLGRELSHAGIGAVVVGCLGLGLALCL